MNLRDIMHPDPERVRGEYPLANAAARMVKLGIRHLPVVDDDGKLTGLLTDADVFRRGSFLDARLVDPRGWVAHDAAHDDLRCHAVMQPVEVTLNPELAASIALAELHRSDQDALVVVDSRFRPVGIVTEHDVLALALDELDSDVLTQAIASSPVDAIEVDAPANEAHTRLMAQPFRHLIVTAGGSLHGVLSIRDLVAQDVPRRGNEPLNALLSFTKVQSARPETPLVEVVRTMKAQKIGCMPLVDDRDEPVGIVTRRDVIAWVIGHNV
ncbi:MAG: CBS domain-containing protein [Myxococcota bacterium]